jgi:hypothetical protein
MRRLLRFIAGFLIVAFLACDYNGELLYRISESVTIEEDIGCECPSLVFYDNTFEVDVVLYRNMRRIRGSSAEFEICYQEEDVYSCLVLELDSFDEYVERQYYQIDENSVDFDVQFAP